MRREAGDIPMANLRHRRSVILVVDDVEGNRELLCRRLAPFGYDLHQVESGQAALDFIRARKPDLVLLDYMMPVMNDVEVVRVLRQDWQLATLPVIMVTARAESEAVVAALDAGADDYVTKPIDFEVLRARIETQLAKQRSSDQLKQANAALDERATMRVLAFDELKNELEREITMRRHAEKALKEAQGVVSRCRECGLAMGCSVPEGGPLGPVIVPSLADGQGPAKALDIIDAMARAVAAGRALNPAMLSALRAKVAEMGGG